MSPTKRSTDELDTQLAAVRSAPTDGGELQLIVRRPGVGEREALDEAKLDPAIGLDGDNWFVRGSKHSDDGAAEAPKQLTIMSSRAAAAVAGDRANWALAGDQLYVDMDISHENLPAGTRLRLGEALLEISEPPHTGCQKFTKRFGLDAMRWVNSDVGKPLRLRGVNCRIIESGTIRLGDTLTKA